MNPAAFTLLVSVAFHATVIASGYAIREMLPRAIHLDVPPPRVEIVEVVDLPTLSTATLDVAMLDASEMEKLVAASLPLPSESAMTPSRQTRSNQRIAAAHVIEPNAAIGEIREVDPHAPGARGTVNPMFSMRNDRQIDLRLRLPSDHHVPRGTDAVHEPPPSGELAPSGNGTHRTDKGVFTAKVNRDGTVDLKDGRNLRIGIPDPRKLPARAGKVISDWADNPNKLPNDPDRVAINNHRTQDVDTRPDHGRTVKLGGGSFDITDALMRRKKIDPYAAEKLRYLDSTRDERVQIGHRHRAQQLAQSAALMQKTLDAVTASPADDAAKKQALFELWDDCAETGSQAMVEGGMRARALVVGYIRAKFPADSATAFTATELARFNQRKTSTARFDPYR